MMKNNDPASSLYRFCHLCLEYNRINVDEHSQLLNTLTNVSKVYIETPFKQWRDAKKTQTIILILLPRGTYKTTVASNAFPMWLLHKQPNARILIDSETYNLSKSILSQIKQQYEYGPYSKMFDPIDQRKTERWAEDSIILPSRTVPNKEGSINAAGLDGVKAGMHYDIIICDDLHSQHNTKNQRQIDEVIEHYKLLLPILEPHGTLIVIGTRWTAEDAYTEIEKNCDYKLFIPAVSTVPMNIASQKVTISGGKSVLVYEPSLISSKIDDGQVITVKNDINNTSNINDINNTSNASVYYNFPHTLSSDTLQKLETIKGEYNYSAQYLLRPIASKEKRFRDEWIKYYEINPTLKDPTPMALYKEDKTHPPNLDFNQFYKIGFVDPAFTTTEYSDPSGIVIVATDSDRNIYVKHAEAIKLEPYDLIKHLFLLGEKHSVREWYIEEVAAQKVLRFFMEYLAGKENKKITISPVKSGGRKKEIRIMSLQPYFEHGKIFVHESQGDLVKQLKSFPILKHDDVLDALAYVPEVVYDGVKISPVTVRPEGHTFDEMAKTLKPSDRFVIRPQNKLKG